MSEEVVSNYKKPINSVSNPCWF